VWHSAIRRGLVNAPGQRWLCVNDDDDDVWFITNCCYLRWSPDDRQKCAKLRGTRVEWPRQQVNWSATQQVATREATCRQTREKGRADWTCSELATEWQSAAAVTCDRCPLCPPPPTTIHRLDRLIHSRQSKKVRRHVGSILKVNIEWKPENFYAKVTFADTVFSVQAQQFESVCKLTTIHCCNIVYLQHGGIDYYRQNYVTVTPRTQNFLVRGCLAI